VRVKQLDVAPKAPRTGLLGRRIPAPDQPAHSMRHVFNELRMAHPCCHSRRVSLTDRERSVLRALRRSEEPLSGRRVGEIVDLAPNTATRLLKGLEERGLVTSTPKGRASNWTSAADVGLLAGLNDDAEDRIALVLTAVELEATAVKNRLVNPKRVRVGGLPLVQGEVIGPDLTWTVFLAQAGMGNSSAAALVALAADKLNANLVSFVGTAGGLKEGDQRLGDVIVASRIHTPYTGKQVPGEDGSELLGRDNSRHVPAPLLRMAEAAIADSAWASSKAAEHYDKNHSHAYVAPIVAVESVQTDPTSELMEQIRKRYQDAAAVDMESHGLATGSDVHDLPMLVVRGLSDFLAGKNATDDEDRQPKAAANAAQLLVHILRSANPEDFRRVAGSSEPGPGPPAPADPENVREALPRGLVLWLDRLRRRSPARADAAEAEIREMRAAGTTAATALNRFIHRPPTWLREDDTGDGWVLVANLGAIAGSSIASRAFERAGHAAALTGDTGAVAYFKLIGVLNLLRDDADADVSATEEAARLALEAVPSDVQDSAAPLFDFYRVALREQDEPDMVEKVEAAAAVLTWLGVEVESSVLRPRDGDFAPHPFDEELRAVLGAMVLQQVSRWFLAPEAADWFGVKTGLAVRGARGNPVVRDLADEALLLAQQAVKLRPMSEGLRLSEAQAGLATLVAIAGRPQGDVEWEVSSRARQAELTALEVRDTFRDWNGDSGPALAVAGRAREMQGDPSGALRMLLPLPDGMATHAESKHPDVVRVAAFLALEVGQDSLAVELAGETDDPVEAALMKAAIYGSRAAMSDEATAALLEALRLADGRHHALYRALNGLARKFGQLSDDDKAAVSAGIDEVSARDPELGELLKARIALENGSPQKALEIVRGLEESGLTLITRAEALGDLGRPAEAWQVLFDGAGSNDGVEMLFVALDLASVKGLHDEARKTAQALLNRGVAGGAKVRVLQTLRSVERADGNWKEVINLTGRIAEDSVEHGLPVIEADHWIEAEALYSLGRFKAAVEVLSETSTVRFNQREKVLLFLSALGRGLDEQRVAGTSDSDRLRFEGRVFTLFLEAAREWVQDREIANLAMGISLTAGDGELSESQVMDLRAYAESYFEIYEDSDSPAVRRVDVGDDLEQLEKFLRDNDSEARREQLVKVLKMVAESVMPVVALAIVAQRSYAEMLLRGRIGFFIAVADDGGLGVETAREAINGQVSADTSALVVGPLAGIPARQLIAKFDSVSLAQSLRTDVERARSSFATRSSGTLGYDARAGRPFITEFSEEETERYRDGVNELWSAVQKLRVGKIAAQDERATWLGALQYAREAGIPLWADDVAMRNMARESGVPAFGTLDLIRAYADAATVDSAEAALRANKVVDLPIVEPWAALAVAADWEPASAFRIAIARPYAWQDIAQAFAEFRGMVRSRPDELAPEVLASWVHSACTGLAMVTQPAVRPQVVAAVIAWTIFETDPLFSPKHLAGRVVNNAEVPDGAGVVSQMMFEVADHLREDYFPDGDPMTSIVETLSGVIRESAGPQAAARVMADLATRLSNGLGNRVFGAYLGLADT